MCIRDRHDYAQKTEYEKPIVPSIMLMGIITSAISKHLPGPGSHAVSYTHLDVYKRQHVRQYG